MKPLLAAVLAATLTGCAGSQYDQIRNGTALPLAGERDRLECEIEGLKASGPGTAGLWNQVRVEALCLRARGVR